jgi:hypothetical protein
MAIEFGLRGRQHLLEPIEDKDDAFQARHHPQPPAAATPQPTAPVGHQAQPRSDSGDAGEPGEGQTGHGAAGDGEPGAFDLLQRLGSSPLGPQPDFTRWAANSGHSALNDLPPPQVQAPPPPATGPRAAYVRGQDRYEPDDSFQSWQEEFAPPPANASPTPLAAPALSTTPPPVANLANVANAATAAPPTVTIGLETDGGTTQLLFSASQQADVAPPPPQFALTATASAAATANSPPPSGPYTGERPADVAWLRHREAALIAVRGDFEAQRNQAQAQPPSFDGPVGPGWVAFTPRVGRDGSEIVPTGLLVVEVRDPNAPAQYSSDEENTYTPAPSQRYVFDEAAFTQHYQTQAFANPNSALQTLARRGYDTDAASLLNAHPEIWGMAASDHAINAGPAQAGRAMGDPGQLAQLDLYMADPQVVSLMQAYGGSPEPARSSVALEQVRVYGEARYLQMTRMADAMQAVRDRYSQAVEQAANSGSGPGWGLQPKTVRQHVGTSGDNDVYADVVVMQAAFDVDAFTAWYQAEGGLANTAFKDFYGNSHTAPGEWVDNGEGSGTWSLSSTTFDNPNWQMTGFGGALAHSQLISLDLNNKPSLRDDAAVGFDLQAGWATAHGNIYKKQGWVDVAIPLIMVAAVSYFSAGTLGPAAASAMGATAGTTTAVVVAAAVTGAATSLVSGLLYDNLSFKGVLIGALTGAVTAGAMQGLGNVVGAANIAAGTAGGFAANFTVQTGIQALIKGGLSEQMLLTGFASALGQSLAANMEQGIVDAKLQGAEAFAARGFAKVLTSAVRAMANPNDPNYGFASALLDSVVNGGLGALDAAAHQEGLQQRNQMDLQSDEAQQSDDILARRGREALEGGGTNVASNPPRSVSNGAQADPRTDLGHFVPNAAHDQALADLNADLGIGTNTRDNTTTGPDTGPGNVAFDEGVDDGNTSISPSDNTLRITITGRRFDYGQAVANKLGGELQALFNEGKAVAGTILEYTAAGIALVDIPPLKDFQTKVRDYLLARADAGGLSEAEMILFGTLYAANEALMPTNALDFTGSIGKSIGAAAAVIKVGKNADEVAQVVRAESRVVAEEVRLAREVQSVERWTEREAKYVSADGQWVRKPEGVADAAAQLEASLTRGGSPRPVGEAASPHHVVGFGKEDRAAQDVLNQFGISPNEIGNGIWLSREQHALTFSNSYKTWVGDRLNGLSSAAEVRVELEKIKAILLSGTAPWKTGG